MSDFGDALAEGLGLVRGPFELAVALAGGRENGEFANARTERRLEAKIAVERLA